MQKSFAAKSGEIICRRAFCRRRRVNLKRTSVIVLIASLLLIIVSWPAAAQTTAYEGLDLVFLIDQSGSMGGKAFSTTVSTDTNDPNGIRFLATRFGIDWLGNFRAQQALFGTQLDINTAVIYFGDEAETQLDWRSITPDNLDAWQSQPLRSELLDTLSANAFAGRNLGNTDFIEAFEAAFGLFRGRTNPDRLQAIILLTDGAPCAPERYNDSNCDILSAQSRHLQDLSASVNSSFDAPNRFVFAVALDADDSFWSRLQPFWENVTKNGLAQRLERSDQFGVAFNNILTELAGQLVAEQDERAELGLDVGLPQLSGVQTAISAENGRVEFDVPPYQQLMSISLFKSRQNAELVLLDPFNNPISSSSDGVSAFGEGELIEIWQITNPWPGPWQIGTVYSENGSTFADSYANASVDLLQARFDLKVPLGTQPMMGPVELAIEVRDARDELLPLYDESYRLAATVTVTAPDGTTLVRALQPEGNSSRYVTRFIPWQPGRDYRIAATAEAEDIRFAAESDELNVSLTNVLIEGIEPEVLEGIEQSYRLRFVGAGNTGVDDIIVEQYKITMIPETASCDQPGAAAETLPEFIDEGSVLTITATHRTIGANQRMCALVSVRDDTVPEGSSEDPIRVILNDELAQVTVHPVQPVAFRLIRPYEFAVNEVRPIELTVYRPLVPSLDTIIQRPQWQVEPLVVSVELVDRQTGQPLDQLRQSLDAASFFNIDILSNDQNILDENVYLNPMNGNLSRWSSEFGSLEPGSYQLIISAPSARIGDTHYAILPENRMLNVPLRVVVDSAAQLEQAVIAGSSSVFALAMFGIAINRLYLKRRNPVRGYLNFIRVAPDGSAYRVLSMPLDFSGNKFNRTTVPLTNLPVVRPPLTSLTVKSRPNSAAYLQIGINGKPHIKEIRDGEAALLWSDVDGNAYYVLRNRHVNDGEVWQQRADNGQDEGGA
jgi:hypothetical protein